MEQQLLDVLIGSIMPPIVDLINRRVASSKARFWVSILLTVAVAVFFNLNEFRYDTPQQFLASVLTVVITAQAVYVKLYEDSRLQQNIRA